MTKPQRGSRYEKAYKRRDGTGRFESGTNDWGGGHNRGEEKRQTEWKAGPGGHSGGGHSRGGQPGGGQPGGGQGGGEDHPPPDSGGTLPGPSSTPDGNSAGQPSSNDSPIPTTPLDPSSTSLDTSSTAAVQNSEPETSTSITATSKRPESAIVSNDTSSEQSESSTITSPTPRSAADHIPASLTVVTTTGPSGATMVSTVTMIANPTMLTQNESDSNLHISTILAIIFGALSFLVILILSLLYLRKRRKREAMKTFTSTSLFPTHRNVSDSGLLDYEKRGSFFFDTHKQEHTDSEFMSIWDSDKSSLSPSDSISQAHIRLSMKRKTVASTAALSALSEETDSAKTITHGVTTIVDDSVMSDTSHTEVKSALGHTKMGYSNSRIREKDLDM
ncbi:hypothetical protein K435DRAFT_969937 [Dendrothele bispora CBS 962.96]|uniref:Uncharacterized protein n=1 Tax=Dendrothele bispora (strain CBS 962.96) TaxID=1314807 RepID=A0A4S8LEH6_DENBC|nr:hypothetical protein K435DRAFT_969937 [Dendrothele bispora CBS 962.96]